MHIFQLAAMAIIMVLTNSLAVAAKSPFAALHYPRSDTTLSTSSHHYPRGSPDFTSSTLIPSKSVINATKAACSNRLLALNSLSSSPTGMSVCYDIASLNNSTGEFTSQIFLYQVSPATGNWTNIDPTSLNVNIAYPGANLTQSALTKRHLPPIFPNRDRRHSQAASPTPRLRKRDTHPVLIASEAFRGRVLSGWNPNDIPSQMKALSPLVTVTALTLSAHFPLQDTLSKTEAAFVTGAFAAEASASAAAAAAIVTQFVLPGTSISAQIYPVGLIITGIWAVLFVLVVGSGTLARLRWRQAYRHKARMQGWRDGNVATKAIVAYDKI